MPQCPYVVMATWNGIDMATVDENGERYECILDNGHDGHHVSANIHFDGIRQSKPPTPLPDADLNS